MLAKSDSPVSNKTAIITQTRLQVAILDRKRKCLSIQRTTSDK